MLLRNASIFFLSSALVFTSACSVKSETTEPAVEPVVEWKWHMPSPPVPEMAWVPAGAFRTSDRTPETVTAIVIHTTEGRFNDERTHAENQRRNFEGVIGYFKNNNRNVSSHYVMGPGGEICQMVNEKDVAHTQTYYNGRAFGIECAGWSSRPETWTPEMIDSLVNLCAYLCVKWEIPPYQPEGTAWEGPWMIELDEDTKRFTGPGLVGHYQVQPWNKSDPGPHFDWDGFSKRVEARIREYGVEPIPLPDPGSTNEVVVHAKLKDAEIKTNEPFTWMLTITGDGVDTLTLDNVMFPQPEKIANIELVSGPTIASQTKDKAVFEMTFKRTNDEAANLHAGRVNLNGIWHDSPTVRVR